MRDDVRPDGGKIAAFTGAGVALLVLARVVGEDAYWQGVLVNLGTTLLLFALLVLAEPSLVRRIDAARRRPRDVTEAQQRVAAVLTAGGPVQNTPDCITTRVLDLISGTGLHLLPPNPPVFQFENLGNQLRVEWTVRRESDGISHRVRFDRHGLPADLVQLVPWSAGHQKHEARVQAVLTWMLGLR